MEIDKVSWFRYLIPLIFTGMAIERIIDLDYMGVLINAILGITFLMLTPTVVDPSQSDQT